MEILVMEPKVGTEELVLNKLVNTVEGYRERYPELGYVTSGMALFRQQNPQEELMPLMLRLSTYMKDKLFEYYVIRVIQHKFQLDLEAVKEEKEFESPSDTYLEFLGFKETTPIK